jgi:hypothetical protein
VNGRGAAKTEGRLVVDVDTFWYVGERDNVNVVGGLGRVRLDGRWLEKAREAFAIALYCGVDPVANGDIGTGVRKSGVNIARDGMNSCGVGAGGEESADDHGAAGRLHGEDLRVL